MAYLDTYGVFWTLAAVDWDVDGFFYLGGNELYAVVHGGYWGGFLFYGIQVRAKDPNRPWYQRYTYFHILRLERSQSVIFKSITLDNLSKWVILSQIDDLSLEIVLDTDLLN